MSDEVEEYPWSSGTVHIEVVAIGFLLRHAETMLHPTELDMFRGGREGLLRYEGKRLVDQVCDGLTSSPDRVRVHIGLWDKRREWERKSRLFEVLSRDELREQVPNWLVEADRKIAELHPVAAPVAPSEPSE